MGEMGVGNDSLVVFYDQKGIASSARGWWLMGLFGHDAAAVLDGGLPAWRRAGLAIETSPALPRAPTTYRASFRAERLRGIGDMMRPDPARRVLDARPAGRFAGTAPEPRPGLPSGHMPGSASLPSTDLVAPDGTMLPPAELRARFAAVGIDGTSPVVTSCGTGVTATILSLGLIQGGFDPGAVYDGSWTEWASRPGHDQGDQRCPMTCPRKAIVSRPGCPMPAAQARRSAASSIRPSSAVRPCCISIAPIASPASTASARPKPTASWATRTHHALENVIAEIEGGTRCQIVSSGLAAVTTPLLAYLKSGDHCLMPDSVYGPARTFADGMLRNLGIETTYYARRSTPPGCAPCSARPPPCSISRARAATPSRCKTSRPWPRWHTSTAPRC